jgi:hypothetical protein
MFVPHWNSVATCDDAGPKYELHGAEFFLRNKEVSF